jgi:hypothetical protein
VEDCVYVSKSFLGVGPILNFALGANFDPQLRSCPPEVKLSPVGEILCLPLHSSKQ